MMETGQLAFWRRLEETLVAFPEQILWGDFRYRDLEQSLDRVGNRLWSLGLASRDRAALVCRDPFLSLVLGTALAWHGLTLVILNPDLPDLPGRLEKARTSAVFADGTVPGPLPAPWFRIDEALTLPAVHPGRIPVNEEGDDRILAIFPDSGVLLPYESVLGGEQTQRFLTDLPFYEVRGFVGLMGHLLRGSTLYFGGSGELTRVRPGAAALTAGDCAALAADLRKLEDSRWELALLRGLVKRGGNAPMGRLRRLTAPVLGGNLRAIGGESRETQGYFRELGVSWLDLGENEKNAGKDNIM